jgi:hypothetical protein
LAAFAWRDRSALGCACGSSSTTAAPTHALASRLPPFPGHHATFSTGSWKDHFRTHRAEDTSHMRIVLSVDPESNHFPVASTATLTTLSSWPRYRRHRVLGYGLSSLGEGRGGSMSFGFMFRRAFETRGQR